MQVRRSVAILFSGACAAALALGPSSQSHADEAPQWLRVVSAYRAMAGLPPVREEPAWTASVRAHADYVAATGLITHFENPTVRGFTRAGDEAGRNAVLGAWTDDRTDRQLIDLWMTAPFHALHILDPRLQRSSFASVHGGEARFQSTAVLDVGRGRGAKVRIDAPIAFPGPGAVVPLSRFENEYPSPLSSCPGYSAPAGLPVVLQYGTPPGNVVTELSASGVPVEHCTITPDYTSPDSNEQETARRLLVQKNAVIVLPRVPLDAGTTYDVRVTANGTTSWWSFTVSEPGSPIEGRLRSSTTAGITPTTVPNPQPAPARPRSSNSNSKSTRGSVATPVPARASITTTTVR